MPDSFVPSQTTLDKYAAVLVNFALGSGQGVKPGEVVLVQVPDVAKPLALALQNVLLTAKAHPLIRLLPTGFDRDFYQLASDDQLTFFPSEYFKARTKLIDHQISIIAEPDLNELKNTNPAKIILARDAKKPIRDWLNLKENQGKFTWTCGLWGTQAKADEVGLSLEDYWQQIIRACFLDAPNPVAKWRQLLADQQQIKQKLNSLSIDSLKVIGPDVDLTIKLGADRLWQGGGGRNIPSFEFFTSPDWRGTNGWIKFNQPLYRYGQILKGIELEFKNGLVTKASAQVGNKFLQAMLKSPNANKVGEFSLTDSRMSRITHFMAETLFDENIGGPFGNTHLALGMSYHECYRGNIKTMTKAKWEKLGFNDAAEHTDIVSTTDRTVTATLTNGQKIIIYAQGKFTCY